MSTIITRNSATSGSTPSSLVQGELAINVTDGRLFYGSGSGNVVKEFTSISASYSATSSFITASGVYGPYGSNSVISASHAVNGGVTQLLAGSNITLSPTNGKGQVTISSTGGGGPFFNTATGSYGSFYDTTIQINPVGNIARSMSFNTTAITNGVSISGSTSPFNTYIKTENPGVYNIQFSAQVEKTDSGTDEIVIWLRKNDINLTDTATKLTLVGNNTKVVAAWNWFVNSAANDYYQIIWQSADTGMRLYAEPQDGTPGIPSVILTANRVDQFLSNTGSFSGSFTGVFTGSLHGTSSWANNSISSSFSSTASFAPNYVLTSATSSMSVATASYVLNAVSSSFASTVPASGVIGLNLSQIATGSVTASVSLTQFSVTSGSSTELIVRGNGVSIGNIITDTHTITGSLNVSGSLQATSFTGSLQGTASFASTALTASFLNDGYTILRTTADQDVVNNNTVNAPELFFSASANGVYEIDFKIILSSNNTTADSRYGFRTGTGGNILMGAGTVTNIAAAVGGATQLIQVSSSFTATVPMGTAVANLDYPLTSVGSLTLFINANDTIGVTFGNNTTTIGATTRLWKESYIKYRRIK